MQKKPFKEYHLIRALKAFDESTLPLDAFLSNYLRAHKQIGAKDRKFIAESAYGIMRWKGLLDHFKKNPSWEKRCEDFKNFTYKKTLHQKDIPDHIQVSFPKWFFAKIESFLGKEGAKKFCLTSNQKAPTTIRVNPKIIARDELLKKWKETYQVSACPLSPLGIRFHQKINFFGTQEFKSGYFEVQDEGSQLISLLVDAKPKEIILDYCAGSGGKTLGFAPFMEGTGQIYLHDIRERVLLEAKKRLKRASIQNAQILKPNEKAKNRLKGKVDTLLLDVPCSGSGTLRRNPDMKWRFTEEKLQNLRSEQRKIFQEALVYLKKGGKILYATCSIFPEENEEQIAYFCKRFDLKILHQEGWLPEENGRDGFFTATLAF